MKRACALTMAGLPAGALAQTATTATMAATAAVRQDWNSFGNGPDYASLIDGIARMRANADAADPRSWAYWSLAQERHAPLGMPYFLAWHRGLLYCFERQLQAVAGNPRLRLPYWNCYRDAQLPEAFCIPARWNALYAPRKNRSVREALSLAPFAPGIANLQRGLPDAFETLIETLPFNGIHNLLGNAMAGSRAADDPIFWLQLADLDRLWNAWMKSGGRLPPAAGTAYWNVRLDYGDGLALSAALARDSRAGFGYGYEDESLPASLPPQAGIEAMLLASLQSAPGGTALPATFAPAGSPAYGMRRVDANRMALASAARIALDESCASVELPLSAASAALLSALLAAPRADAGGSIAVAPWRGVSIVLDGLAATDAGAAGGYFYTLYLNLPAGPNSDAAQRACLLGSLGAFEIAAARQRMARGLAGSVRIDLPATALLRRLAARPLHALCVSFVRTSGAQSAPSGQTIAIAEMRLELSTEAGA
jgi:tyrosinase